jgi:hypothetical protein
MTDNLSEGTTNLYFTNARVDTRLATKTTDNLSEGTTNLYFTNARVDTRLATKTTDNQSEGTTNLYFTTTRARAAISGGTGVTITDGSIAIDQTVATTSNVTFNNLTLTGELRGPATFTIDPAAVGDNTGTVVIKGNLQIDGTTTTINSTTLTVDDLVLTLGGDTAPTIDDTFDKGIEYRWFDTQARVGFFGFDRSTCKLTFIPQASLSSVAYSGTTGEIDAKDDWSNILNKPTTSTATSTVLGIAKLVSDTAQSIAANAVSATASRTYGIQFNASTQMVVNVPWTDTTYGIAISRVPGLVELASDTAQSVAANAVTATASRTYGLQLNSASQGVINVPWTDTIYNLPTATSTVLGGVELFSDTAQTVAAAAVSATASRTYGIQLNAAGQMVVNVPWVYTNTVNGVNWDGNSSVLVASTGRTSLGATTLGSNLFTLPNVAAISFPRINADNTVSSLSASAFRTAIVAGTGTVTSVSGTGTVCGLTLSGTVTGSGDLTLCGTLTITSTNYGFQPYNSFLSTVSNFDGYPTFRRIVKEDLPTVSTAFNATNAGGISPTYQNVGQFVGGVNFNEFNYWWGGLSPFTTNVFEIRICSNNQAGNASSRSDIGIYRVNFVGHGDANYNNTRRAVLTTVVPAEFVSLKIAIDDTGLLWIRANGMAGPSARMAIYSLSDLPYEGMSVLTTSSTTLAPNNAVEVLPEQKYYSINTGSGFTANAVVTSADARFGNTDMRAAQATGTDCLWYTNMEPSTTSTIFTIFYSSNWCWWINWLWCERFKRNRLSKLENSFCIRC